MQERVQKILARAGIASRRGAEELITAGRVTVDGTVCGLGDRADPNVQTVAVDGKPIPRDQEKTYILLNKPRGYLSTVEDDRGRRTVLELVDPGLRVYPVGRLDMDSEGLLLLTNDGDLTQHLLHPSHRVDKTYQVWLSGVTEAGLSGLGQAMDIDGYRIRPARVEVLSRRADRARVQITIHEGRNRQIRKMAAQCGMSVTRLRRIQEGPIALGNLSPGSWRYLTEAEIAALQA